MKTQERNGRIKVMKFIKNNRGDGVIGFCIILVVIAGVILVATVSFDTGKYSGKQEMKERAIKANLASYVCNPTNGVVEFKFKGE